VLPDYTVRRSPRARRMRLTVSPLGRVEVVVPRRMAQRHVEPFVREHRDWIVATQHRIESERADCGGAGEGLPQQIELRAIGELWRVEAETAPRSGVREAAGTLYLKGEDDPTRYAALRRWNSRKAKQYLLPWLQQWSDNSGLRFNRLTIRGQRSRWGSCSSGGNISLNRKLLFLPPEQVDYILVHELCHIRYPNHSSHFWGLVGEVLTDYRQRDAAMRQASRYVPHWAYSE